MSKDEVREIEEVLEKHGLAAAVAKIRDYLKQLDRVELNIAVTGESGTGKSTFVNAIRGLGDDDEGAAPTGVVETTMEPTITFQDKQHPGKRKRSFNEAETLQLIRQDCIKGLRDNGLESPMVFLISGFDLQLYDFPKLEETIEEELPKHKRRVFLLSLPNINRAINRRKKESLQKNIWMLALLSASAATLPIPGFSIAVDVAILVEALQKYYKAFGLDHKSLENLSKTTGVPLSKLRAELKSPLNVGISVDLVTKLLITTAGAGLIVLEESVALIPLIGCIVAGGISYKVTYSMLERCLNELAQDAHNVLMTAMQTEL
ncbi:hypothetical protein GJAV_G00003370 [Gymnothorax javanicus]|nr:hypothetical protein GJAV_G00003370 [Gymnothorax javanicus]